MIHYHTTCTPHVFSTVFDMSTLSCSQGTVIKNIFHLTTHYDCFDRYDLYEAQGVCRLLSLGRFSDRATEIDIYDDRGNYIGSIHGKLFNSELAKFNFYNAEGEKVAISYLDYDGKGFSIVHPLNTCEILARLSWHSLDLQKTENHLDYWDVTIYDYELISPLLVKIFAAFTCDKQDFFKKTASTK